MSLALPPPSRNSKKNETNIPLETLSSLFAENGGLSVNPLKLNVLGRAKGVEGWGLKCPQDLLAHNLKHAPRRSVMMKFGDLAAKIIDIAPNGVLNPMPTKEAIDERVLIRPGLIANVKKPAFCIVELSTSVRALMSWFRAFKRNGKAKVTLMKGALAAEEAVLAKAVHSIVLKNKEPWVNQRYLNLLIPEREHHFLNCHRPKSLGDAKKSSFNNPPSYPQCLHQASMFTLLDDLLLLSFFIRGPSNNLGHNIEHWLSRLLFPTSFLGPPFSRQ